MKHIHRLFIVFVLVLLSACTTEQADTYSLQFETNGGTVIETMELEAGETIVMPDDPTKSGFVFEGWYNDEFTALFLETEMPPFDVTLYAKWDENTNATEDTITITFNSNGGSAISSITVVPGDNISEPTSPTRNGYTFGGWFTSTSYTTLFSWSTAPDEDTTLYAKWMEDTVQTYTIIFQSNGGSTITTQIVEEGQMANEPTDPTRNGYTFDGWYSNSALTTLYNFGTAVTSNITLYAKWTEIAVTTYTVTFQSNQGSSVSTQTIEEGQTATEPTDPTRNGYTFDGWYSNSALTTLYNFGTAVTSNITLYAKWTEIVTNTATDDVIAVLEQWDFVCSNNICVYEEYSWSTYTFDLNTVTFTFEQHITDDQDPSYYKDEVLTIDENWSVDYTISESVGNTSMRLTGNATTGNYSFQRFSSSIYEEDDYYDDMVTMIEGGTYGGGLVAMIENALTTADVTMDDLT